MVSEGLLCTKSHSSMQSEETRLLGRRDFEPGGRKVISPASSLGSWASCSQRLLVQGRRVQLGC